MTKEILGVGSRVKHPEFGEGVVIQASSYSYRITFISVGIREISHEFEGLEIIDAAEMEGDLISLYEVEERLINILRKFSDVQETVELGNRWLGGHVLIQPADKNLKPKEIPINAFFGKIILLRDRLRVLEQRINSHDKLTEEDKITMQQYITRCYGSLTTFNVLFKNPKEQFVGEKGTKD